AATTTTPRSPTRWPVRRSDVPSDPRWAPDRLDRSACVDLEIIRPLPWVARQPGEARARSNLPVQGLFVRPLVRDRGLVERADVDVDGAVLADHGEGRDLGAVPGDRRRLGQH